MTKCKKWINGKCFSTKGITCSEYCPFYDPKFCASKAVRGILEYTYRRDSDGAKMKFHELVEELGPEAEEIMGTLSWADFKAKHIKNRRGKNMIWNEERINQLIEMRKAGLSFNHIAIEMEREPSTIRRRWRMIKAEGLAEGVE